MFKPAPLVAVAIALLLLVSPFAIGSFTESGLREQIENYNQNPSISASVESYERGWFDATARIRFGFADSVLEQFPIGEPSLPVAAMLQGLEIPIVVEVAHGPILTRNGFGLGTAAIRAYIDPESPMVAIAENLLGLPYLFEFRGRAGFGTGFRFEGEIPGAETAFEDLSYSFSGLEYSGRARNGDTELEASTDNLSIQSPFFSAILQSLAMQYDYDYRPDQIALANGEFSIANVTATNPLLGAAPLFAGSDLLITVVSDENDAGTHIDASVVYGAGSLEVADLIAINDAAIGINASHLDGAALMQLQDFATNMPLDASDEELLVLLTPILDQLIAGDPVISLEPARFSMSQGDFEGRAMIAIDSSVLPTGSFTELVNPLSALQAVSAELEMSVSKTLAAHLAGMAMGQQLAALAGPGAEPMAPEQAAAMAEAQFTVLVAQGLLVDDGERYSTSIEYAGGTAMANGQPIPLGAL
ncbi:MAG TPA: DUF945 family protein [Gammaproteobacteria bacterium]